METKDYQVIIGIIIGLSFSFSVIGILSGIGQEQRINNLEENAIIEVCDRILEDAVDNEYTEREFLTIWEYSKMRGHCPKNGTIMADKHAYLKSVEGK